MTDRPPFPIADSDLAARLRRPDFPRAARYDPRWVLENAMGPNPIWLVEALLPALGGLRPGARVLDLGCGRAITSIFLALELDVEVWAADLWIEPTPNLGRIRAAGVGDRVVPLHVEAHRLPFAEGFFDAVVSADAYHYFGTDDLYLSSLRRFVVPGGPIAIAVPGLVAELDEVPEHLAPAWTHDWWSFHSPGWWRRHAERTGPCRVDVADLISDGWRLWADGTRVRAELGLPELFPGSHEVELAEIAALEADAGRNLGFTRLVARA